MQVKVHDKKGKASSKKVKLPKSIFGVEPNDHLIYLEVKRYMAQRHSGKHKAKLRSEVRGSTAKIRPQKGTGRARAGSRKSPIFRGGGVAFAPQPRDHSIKVNKKERLYAKKSALTYKAKEEGIHVLKDFKLEKPKTKKYQQVLENLKASEQKTLLVLPEYDKNIVLSGRNIPNTRIATVEGLNIYDILNAEKILFFESAFEKLESYFKPGEKKAGKKKTKTKKTKKSKQAKSKSGTQTKKKADKSKEKKGKKKQAKKTSAKKSKSSGKKKKQSKSKSKKKKK